MIEKNEISTLWNQCYQLLQKVQGWNGTFLTFFLLFRSLCWWRTISRPPQKSWTCVHILGWNNQQWFKVQVVKEKMKKRIRILFDDILMFIFLLFLHCRIHTYKKNHISFFDTSKKKFSEWMKKSMHHSFFFLVALYQIEKK